MNCFPSLNTIILLLLFPFGKKWALAQMINCNAGSSCSGLTAMCDNSGTPCEVTCDGNNCDGLTLDCNTNPQQCRVICTGGADACVDLEVNCASGQTCSVECAVAGACTGEVSFTGSAFNQAKGPQVYCQASGSCSGGTFNAPDRNFFGLSCQANNACDATMIDCGTTQNCNLNCDFGPNSCLNTVQDCSSVMNICNKDCFLGCNMVDQICTPTATRSCTCNDPNAPSAAPSVSGAPSARPSVSGAPSARPSLSTMPSQAPFSPTASPTSSKSMMGSMMGSGGMMGSRSSAATEISALESPIAASSKSSDFSSSTGGYVVYGVVGFIVGAAGVAFAITRRRQRSKSDVTSVTIE